MSAASPASNGTTHTVVADQNAGPPKKTVRKKKESNAEDSASKLKESKKIIVKKPRPLKDPNAPPIQRKRKAAGDPSIAPSTILPASSQASTSIMNSSAASNSTNPSKIGSSLPAQHKITDLISPTYQQQSSSTTISNAIKDPPTPNQRPASSGRMFDPIRGATVDKPPVSPTPQPAGSLNRASASPAIKSLMNPAPSTEPIRMAPISPATAMSRQPSGTSIASVLSNAPQAMPSLSNKASVPTKSRPSEGEVPTKSKKVDTVSAPASNAPTPPQKPKISREVPPLPSGSGLLSGTPFGLTAAPNGSSTLPAGTNIWLKFDLKGKENVTINFALEVEKKYGAAALNPRLAARKERQRQLALAGAALEKELGESAEDMSIDMSEPESNNDTDGPNKDGTDGEPAKKKRKRRTEDYDRNDDFIDDEEVLLEEQALMTRDGFFVYSGPLIQEGERPAVERADGSIRRGRGRGRGGRGGATVGEGRAGAVSGATAAAAKKSSGAGKAGGANGVRKPRATKAEKAATDAEKAALAAAKEKTAGALLAVRPVPAAATAAS